MTRFKVYFIQAILFGLLIAPVKVLQSQTVELQNEIGKIIRHEVSIDFTLVPGLLIGIMDGDSVYTFSVGEKQNKLDSYEVGSITKPLVAWLTAQALDSLGWTGEDKVCRFLPDSLCLPGWEQLTINHLLTHRSGLVRLPPGIGKAEINMDDPYMAYDLASLVGDLKRMDPHPGMYSYSHVNYILLYWLFERVGGIDFFFQQKMAVPFDFIQTGFHIPDEKLAPGHDRNGFESEPWHCNALTLSLGMRSGLLDLLNFIKYTSHGLQHHAPVWSPRKKRELEKQMNKGIFEVVDGWFIVPDQQSLIFYNNGFTGGHHVSIAFSPANQKVAIVIFNGALGSGELSMLILEMLLDAKYK